jgi:hypothetical protein
VACRGQRQVKVTEKEGTNKMDGEKKKTKIRQKRGVSQKNKKVHGKSLGESTHDPNQEGSGDRPFNHRYLRKGPTCPITEHIQSCIGT